MYKVIRTVSIVICIAAILFGVGVLVYPGIAQYLFHQESEDEIAAYNRIVSSMSEEQIEEELAKAYDYNRRFYEDRRCQPDYNEILDVNGEGMMGYIEIPEIGLSVPVYHGTEESTLDYEAGHVDDSTLPVGGENTHAVIMGHSGMANADLFSNLNLLKESDVFFITVLDRTLAYRIVSTEVVKPVEVYKLTIEDGFDLVTLVTCTPYGINTHRLLVTGERIDWDGPVPGHELSFWQRLPHEYRLILLAAAGVFVLILLIKITTSVMKRKRSIQ